MRNVGIVALILFGGCTVKEDDPITLQGFNPCRVYTSPAAEVNETDTFLTSGKYVDFFLNSDSTLMVSWGSTQYGKAGAQEYDTWPMPRGVPWYLCEFDDYIAMRESCGSSCWCLILLPIKPNDSIVVLEEDLLRDTNRGYVFGRRCANENSAEFCLYDVNNHQHTPVVLPGYEWTGDITIALDSLAFVEEGLYVRWTSHLNDGNGLGERDTVIVIE